MPDALSAINLRDTPQSQPADPRQVRNSAGGYTFTVAPLERLRRFLVLGIDGGTYYASERELTTANAEVVLAWARDRPGELVDEVVSISTAGRAPRNNAALFALAIAASLGDGRPEGCAGRAAEGRPDRHPPVPVRGVRRAVPWLGPRAAPGRGGLVPVEAGGRGRLPGGEVPAARGLVAPRPAAARSPGNGRGRPQALFDWICGRGEEGPALVEAFEQAQAATTAPSGSAIVNHTDAVVGDAARRGPGRAGRCGEAVRQRHAADGADAPATAADPARPAATMSGTLEVVVGQLTDRDRLQGAGAPGQRAGGRAHLRIRRSARGHRRGNR